MPKASNMALTIAACSTRKDLCELLMSAYTTSSDALFQQFADHTGTDVADLKESSVKDFVTACYPLFQQTESKYSLLRSFCSEPPCPDSRTFLAMANGVKIRELPKPPDIQAKQAK